MSTKFWIGGAAIAGASYYVYQQRLEQANQPQHSLHIPGFGSSSTSGVGEGPGEKTGRQLDEAAANAREKLRDLQDDAGKTIDHGLSKLERERAKAANWTSDKLEDLSDSLSTNAQDAKERAKALHEQAHRDDPKGLKKLGNDIKQTAIDAKQGTEERLGNAKDTVVGGVSSLKHTIIDGKNRVETEANKAADTGSSWFKSGTNKTDDAARNAQRALEGWGESAKQNADAYYDSLSGTRKPSDGFFNWGKGRETEDSINAAYEEAQKIYNDAQARVNSTKGSWFSFGQDDQKKRLHEEAQRQLDAAQSQLNSATSKLNEWKERAKNSVNQDRRSNGFYHWLRGGTPVQEEEIARAASRSLRGWGESAEAFSREEYEEAKRARAEQQGLVHPDTADHIQKKLDSWSRWANKKYDSNQAGAEDYYNDAQQAFKDAQNELNKTAKSWWSWGSKKSSEVDVEARRNYDEAQRRLNEATDNLSKWSSDKAKEANLKFWSSADDALHETKKGVDSLSNKAVNGLDNAQKWVKDQK